MFNFKLPEDFGIRVLTQEAYDAITPDPNTIYVVRPSVAISAPEPEPEPETEQDPEGWSLLYGTEFTTNDGWAAREETQSNDNSYNTPNNVSYGPNGMVIAGKREVMGGRPFTTGDVTGKHVVVPNYFRADVTATLPIDYGMWPCPLWLRPLNSDDGEIDLAETWTHSWNGTPAVQSAIHPAYTHPVDKHHNSKLLYSELPNPDPAASHIYTCIKTKDRIEFLVDGVRVYCWGGAPKWDGVLKAGPLPDWYSKIFEVEGRTWYPRITLQIGGAGNPEPKPEWQNSELAIHKLRIYKQA